MVSESCIYIRMPGLSQLYVNPTFSFFERQRATGSKKRRQSTTKKRKEIIARKEIYNTSTASLTYTGAPNVYIFIRLCDACGEKVAEKARRVRCLSIN